MALNAWCFSKELIGNQIKILDGTRIHIDGAGEEIFHNAGSQGFGKIISANWNSDGALVVKDDKGFLHHYLGLQHKFTAYNGDETYFTNSIEYKRALEECEEYRSGQGKVKKNKVKKNNSQKNASGKKGPWWWRGIKWIFKGIFKLLTFGVFVALSKDESE